MRNREDVPRRRRRWGLSGRGRGVVITFVVILLVLVFSLRALARVFTDYLWFDSLGVAGAWGHQIGYQVMLAVVFTLAYFVLLGGNLLLVNRLAPPVLPRRTGDELVERYHEMVGGRQRSLFLLVSFGMALLFGVGVSSQWKSFVLFRFGGTFDRRDPLHHVDVGFYVFKLPFLSYVVSWLFVALIFVILIVAVAHLLTGAIHAPGAGAPAGRKVKAHLSALFAALALVKAAGYVLDRYRLTTSRGVVTGALYTDVNARLPVNTLLVLIAILCAAVFVVNIRRRGWGLPMIGVGLWALMAVVAGTVYPAVLQKLKVDSQESQLEAPYIRDNMSATRWAMGIDHVVEKDFDYQEELSDADVTANAATIANVRLLDPNEISSTFTTLQSKLNYYRFSDLDVDRYRFGSDQTEVVIGARELDQDSIPQKTWEARHLRYTHGYGVAMAPANAVNEDGEPDFAVSDVPVTIDTTQLQDVSLRRPEIYFGEGLDTNDEAGYAIVGTGLREQGVTEESSSQYHGDGGVAINTFLRRAAFALRFGELEPFTSDYLRKQSRVLYIRDIRARVSGVAPFLQWDHDPYPVLVDGRIKYIVDGYTTASTVPYGEPADSLDTDEDSGLHGKSFNYVRNSVKAVVDAYDGSVKLYVTDTLYGAVDPIVHAYAAAFPEIFTPGSEMPASLRAHLRYPEDLFRVQTATWGRYHIRQPGAFYGKEDDWDPSQRPPSAVSSTQSENSSDSGTSSTTRTERASPKPITPSYLQMRLPNEPGDEFVLLRPFSPHSEDTGGRQKLLNAFMVARSDPADYGRLVVYTMTQTGSGGKAERNRNVDGPLRAHERIASDPQLAQRITQLNGQAGNSSVTWGNMILVPIEQGIMYVRPIYVSSQGDGSAQQLQLVAAAVGDRVEYGDTFAEALGKLFPTARVSTRETRGSTPTTTVAPGGTSPPTSAPSPGSSDVSGLIARAVQLFGEADAALKAGGASNLSEYQDKIEQAQDLVRQAQHALESAGPGSATAGVTTTTSASSG